MELTKCERSATCWRRFADNFPFVHKYIHKKEGLNLLRLSTCGDHAEACKAAMRERERERESKDKQYD